MTAPKRGVQVLIVLPVTRKIGDKWYTEPVKVVRKHKPRNGGGVTLAEFTSRDGDGVQVATAWAEEKGHEVVGMK